MNRTGGIRKPIKSYIIRGGRLTRGQQRAMDQWWPRYGIDTDAKIDTTLEFGRQAPVVMEIGFGDGEALLKMAQDNPDKDFIGVEVHPPGIGHLLLRASAAEIDNLRVIRGDAVEVLARCIADTSLFGICLFFPDPWPKKKHHKRRILQPEFIELIGQKLSPGGYFHFASDWEDYAVEALKNLDQCPQLINRAGAGMFSKRPTHRPLTKFEKRGRNLGHQVWDIMMRKP